MKPRTRLLGVDFGTVRVGLAITDEMRIIASPLATYERRNEAEDAAFFRQLWHGCNRMRFNPQDEDPILLSILARPRHPISFSI